jgi:5-methylthioadenosine/S-adenosylhomocysteine deaminase
VHDNWRRDPLVSHCFAPHAPYTVDDASFERIRMLADQLDVPVHCHVHETAQEVARRGEARHAPAGAARPARAWSTTA